MRSPNATPAAAPGSEARSGSSTAGMNLTLGREDIVRLCERIEGAQTRAYAIPKLTESDEPKVLLIALTALAAPRR